MALIIVLSTQAITRKAISWVLVSKKHKNTVSMCIVRNIYFLKGVQFTAELPDGPLEAKFDMIRVVCCLSLFVCDLNL